jgi:hypothetical protein
MICPMHATFGVIASVAATTATSGTSMLKVPRYPTPAFVAFLVQTAKALDIHRLLPIVYHVHMVVSNEQSVKLTNILQEIRLPLLHHIRSKLRTVLALLRQGPLLACISTSWTLSLYGNHLLP